MGYKPNRRPTQEWGQLEIYEGETIEEKIARIVESNEPIDDGAPIVYTAKKDGVKPEYNIRADKWEIAQNAMDSVNKERIAKATGWMKPEEGGEEQSSEQKEESTAKQ